MASVTMQLPQQRHPHRVVGVLRRGRTYGNLLYLLLALPIAYVYVFVFTRLTATTYVSIYPLGLGLLAFPILFLVCTWALANCERALAHWLLGTTFTPMALALPPGVSLWDRTKAHLRNPVTWKSIVYLALRVPFGVVAFALSAGLLLAALAMIFAPALYLATPLYTGGVSFPWSGSWLVDTFIRWIPPAAQRLAQMLGLGGRIEPQVLALSFLCTALGVVALFVVVNGLNAFAAGWGWLTRLMLGINPKDIQLAEARASATAAHSRAEQSEQARRQLILDASHELRTPVATVRAHIESLLLLESERLPESVRSNLAVTQREMERLGVLVDDLLMLARADADELRLDMQPVSVGEVVEEVFHALEPLAEHERQVTLVREVAANLPPAYADRARLAQVLLNLARNAITYTPAGGLVSLDAASGAPGDAPDTVVLSVTDTGIGIPDDDLDRIFERFYRADASRTRDTGGFGLGLSIVRDLVQAMGGEVVAERVPAGGSRFRVTLRAVPANADQS